MCNPVAAEGGSQHRGKSDVESFTTGSDHGHARWAAVQIVLPAIFIVGFVAIAAIRIAYPYDLDWVEGGYLLQIRRVLDGLPIYDRPSLDFVAAIYTPLYFYISAGVAAAIGYGMLAPRLVSALAASGTMALIARQVYRRTNSRVAAAIGAGLYAACFELTGFAYVGVHPDALAVFFVIAAWVLSEGDRPILTVGLAPLLACLAAITKQTMLPVGIALGVAGFLRETGWRRFAPGLAFLTFAGGAIGALQVASHGWFAYYVAELPSRHPLQATQAGAILVQCLPKLGIAAGVAALGAIAGARFRDRRHAFLDWPVFLALAGVSLSTLAHQFSGNNVLMPLCVLVATTGAIGFDRLARMNWGTAASLAIGAQFVCLAYGPARAVPTPTNRRAIEHAIALVRSIDGPVYWPNHPWYVALAGRRPFAHAMATTDVVRAGSSSVERALEAETAEAIREQRFARVLWDNLEPPLMSSDFGEYYGRLPPADVGPLYPDTDWWPERPVQVFAPIAR
jgi:hypothetical protein